MLVEVDASNTGDACGHRGGVHATEQGAEEPRRMGVRASIVAQASRSNYRGRKRLPLRREALRKQDGAKGRREVDAK